MPLSPTSRLRDRKEKALRKDDGSIEVQCGAPFEPSYIYKMLNSIRSDTFKVEGRQEDAEEFLGCLLNALNDEMLEVNVSAYTLGTLHVKTLVQVCGIPNWLQYEIRFFNFQ